MVEDPPSDDIQVEELEDSALEEVERDEDKLSETLQSEIEEAVTSSREGNAALDDRPTVKRLATTGDPKANATLPGDAKTNPTPGGDSAPPRSALPRPISTMPPHQRTPSSPGLASSSASASSSAPAPSTSSPPPTTGRPAARPASEPPRPRSERPAPLPGPGSPLSVSSVSSSQPLKPPPAPPSRPPAAKGKSLPPPRSLRNKVDTPGDTRPGLMGERDLPRVSDIDEPTLIREAPSAEELTASQPARSTTLDDDSIDSLELNDLQDTEDSDEGWGPDDTDESERPPNIPSLAQRGDGSQAGRSLPKRERNKKGKRRPVRIPDDNVPNAGARSPSRDDDDSDDDELSDRPTQLIPDAPDPSKLVPRAAPIPRIEDIEKPDYSEPKQGRTRESAPGIFTDDQAIAVLRPIMVVSDLPPVGGPRADGAEDQPLAGGPAAVRRRTGTLEIDPAASDALDALQGESPQPGAVKRPPPPKRGSDRPEGFMLDDIEEIVPDRMSLPGILPSSQRRPLPPPRSAMTSDPGLLLDIDIEPPPAIHPTGMDALALLEAEAKAAEDAAREAEARARDAEAKARDAEARAREADRKDAAKDVSDSKRPKKPWWIDWFEGDFVMTLDNPKRKDVERETTFIEQSLALDAGARVLDLGCGHGVHAVELASRGYQLVGVDVSNTMLQFAKDYNTKRKTSVSFIQGDMRELNLEEVFDGIYCWSTTFGFFDEQRNINVLERVWRALRPGGRFALDVANRDYVAMRQPGMAWFERPGCVCMDEMKFDFYTSRLINKRMVMFDTGKSRELESSIRLYSLTELGRLLHNVGFRVLEVSGHRAHRGAYFGSESPRIIIIAERREEADQPAYKP
jgi:SAM-dependent methyltransferase